jgi:vacuolar fusion protein MON1
VLTRFSLARPQLMLQLTYLFNQIISVLTMAQLTSIFEQRRNYDLRRMLGTSTKFLDSMIWSMDHCPSFTLTAVEILPMLAAEREKVAQTISSCRVSKVPRAQYVA